MPDNTTPAFGLDSRVVVTLDAAFCLLCMARSSLAQSAAEHAPLERSRDAADAGYMRMTSPRPSQPGDEQKAATVLAAALKALVPYRDYRQALADGHQIFLADVPQPQYHFTRNDYARDAGTRFEPLRPTSLLYTKTAEGGYKLLGAI